MDLFRLRFRLRTLVAAVAVVAVMIAMVIEVRKLMRLSAVYRQLAAQHASQEQAFLRASRWIGAMAAQDAQSQRLSERDARERALAADTLLSAKLVGYHAALSRKYLRAAAHPWESVPPDPPAPKSDSSTLDSLKVEMSSLIIAMSAGRERLLLQNTGVTDERLKPIESWLQLRTLDLSRTEVTDFGLVSLTKLTNLVTLNLGGTQITDAGLVSLEKLTNLESLTLNETAITDSGLAHLRALPHLKEVSLRRTKVTSAGVKDLAASIPGVTVTYFDPVPVPYLGRKLAK